MTISKTITEVMCDRFKKLYVKTPRAILLSRFLSVRGYTRHTPYIDVCHELMKYNDIPVHENLK